MAQNPVPPPIPTQTPMVGTGGLVTRPWISWFTWVKGLLSESPEFTGTPTVPTAPPMTNGNQVASTAYTDAAVLVETQRAEAAENSLTTALNAETARAAPINSPTFTGVVTQPTPPILTGAIIGTSAAGGSASALPALPIGYLAININGVSRKIAFYA